MQPNTSIKVLYPKQGVKSDTLVQLEEDDIRVNAVLYVSNINKLTGERVFSKPESMCKFINLREALAWWQKFGFKRLLAQGYVKLDKTVTLGMA